MSTFDPFAAQIFRGNDFETPAGAKQQEVINPSTLEVVGRLAVTPAAVLVETAAAAARAQKNWAATAPKARATLLHRLADSIETSRFEEVARLMTLEMGKPYPEAIGELQNVAPIFRYYAEMARDEAGHIAGTTQAGSFQFARYEPYGVSLHIVPYNFPIIILCWTLAASLAAGNACIVKPAETTSLCTLKFMEHFQASMPRDLIACVTGGGPVAQQLIASRDTHVVAFTGSVAAGRRVNVACAERFKPCVIEAGGSDPMVISDKVPLEVAIAGSVTSAFHLSGQICVSSERFYVHAAVHDKFVEGFAAMAEGLRVGDGFGRSEIGPLASEAARDKVMRLVDDAVGAGARVVCGGRVPPDHNTGWFYEPTILTGVTPGMAILQEEIFGPVAAICRVESFEEGLALANDSPFGLGACVFTTDLKEAMQAAETLQAGMVWVNNPLIDNDALPFGGWKNSGVGRELGRQGLEAFRQSKMVIIDHDPRIQEWWYPYPEDWFYQGETGDARAARFGRMPNRDAPNKDEA